VVAVEVARQLDAPGGETIRDPAAGGQTARAAPAGAFPRTSAPLEERAAVRTDRRLVVLPRLR